MASYSGCYILASYNGKNELEARESKNWFVLLCSL